MTKTKKITENDSKSDVKKSDRDDDSKRPERNDDHVSKNKKNSSKDPVKPVINKDHKNKRILEVKISQATALKQVIERTSHVITECCIVFIRADQDDCNENNDTYEDIEDDESNNIKKLKKKSKPDADVKIKKKSKKKELEDLEESDSDNKNKKKSKKKKEDSEESDSDNKSSKMLNVKPASKKINTGGIRIFKVSESEDVIVKITLDASNFETFRCDEPKIIIGVDMHTLNNNLKMISDNDPILLYIMEGNMSTLYIKADNENASNSESTVIGVELIELQYVDYPIPKTEFQNMITIASDKFYDICKKLSVSAAKDVEITSVNNQIDFKCKSESSTVTKTYKDIHTPVKTKKSNDIDQIFQGKYELKHIMTFSKCNKLCQTVNLYLKNEFPLVIGISIANLGKMYVFIMPVNKND